MEPCFNPALEQQAIGRVHRLGQKREVEIIRLIQKDSIESRIITYLERKYGSSSTTPKTEPIAKCKNQKQVDKANKANDEPEIHNATGSTKNQVSDEIGLVGNVSRDKASMMLSDFDLLFGAAPMKDEENEMMTDSVQI